MFPFFFSGTHRRVFLQYGGIHVLPVRYSLLDSMVRKGVHGKVLDLLDLGNRSESSSGSVTLM